MIIRIVEGNAADWVEYARVPIAFEVTEVFDQDAVRALLAGQPANSTAVAAPYWKDYDRSPGHRPTEWAQRFDVSHWMILAARAGAQRLGGAVIAGDDPDLARLDDWSAGALLWDLRVAPDQRRRGVGAALLGAAEAVAVQRGARTLRVETQQVNVPACRFYERHGFQLERAVPGAYEAFPAETQLLWRKDLSIMPSAPPANERG